MNFVAFCENPNCGAIFESTGLIDVAGTATVHIKNSRVGPCPACGGTGRIPDGVYEYTNRVVSLLSGPETTVEILRQVQKVLKSAQANNASKVDVEREIANVSPSVAQAFKSAPSSDNVLQWLSVLIALVALVIQIHTSYFKDDDLEKAFRNQLLEENRVLRQQIAKEHPYQREQPKLQRNQPCPCGSGKKYKKCCGVAAT